MENNEKDIFDYIQKVRISEDNLFFKLLNYNIYDAQIPELLEIEDDSDSDCIEDGVPVPVLAPKYNQINNSEDES
jgi:hypothetical protein